MKNKKTESYLDLIGFTPLLPPTANPQQIEELNRLVLQYDEMLDASSEPRIQKFIDKWFIMGGTIDSFEDIVRSYQEMKQILDQAYHVVLKSKTLYAIYDLTQRILILLKQMSNEGKSGTEVSFSEGTKPRTDGDLIFEAYLSQVE